LELVLERDNLLAGLAGDTEIRFAGGILLGRRRSERGRGKTQQ